MKQSVLQDKDKWIPEQCEEIEKGLHTGKSKQAYRLVKMLKKKFEPKLTVIKEHIKQRWTRYCSSLYKDNGGDEDMVKDLKQITPFYEENSNEILYAEVQEAIHKLKNNKSPGTDEITAEMLQAGGEQLVHEIHELCNKIWKEETIPDEWGKSILVPIPKKRDLSQCSNYRTISLINHTGKILLIVLLNRLKHHLDPYMAEVPSIKF